MKKTELQTMVVAELKALAKKMKIKLPTGFRKADIVELLVSAFKKERQPAPVKKARATQRSTSPAQKNASGSRKNVPVGKKINAERPAIQPAAPMPKPAAVTPPAGLEWKLPPAAEEPIMSQERVSDAKFYTGPGQEQTGSSSELPLGYGEEKIALMPRDPYLAYAYWEMTPSRIEREKSWFGWDGKLTVRIYDVTGVQFDGRNAVGYYDQEVTEFTGGWYFDLGRPAHSFLADLGLLSPDGRFLTIARSNFVTMPRDGISDVIDEAWMQADEEFWNLYGFSGGPSSLQLQHMAKRRRLQQTSSPTGSWGERFKRK